MTDRLQIARARRSDLDAYIDLLEEIAEWLAARGIRQYLPGTFRASRAYFAESIRRGEVHWAFVDDTMVGAVRLLNEDAVVWPEVPEGESVYVYNLVVRRDRARRELGVRILDWAERETQAMGRIFLRLDCYADNAFLRRYYANAGFLACGEVDARYPAPVGTIRLQRYEKRVHPVPAAARRPARSPSPGGSGAAWESGAPGRDTLARIPLERGASSRSRWETRPTPSSRPC